MSTGPINVLYVAEFTTGGSVESLHSLVTGLDKTRFHPTVLFYHEPAARTRSRFEDAGAVVGTLFPGADMAESTGPIPGLGMQVRIGKLLGRRIENCYASMKYLYVFLRFKMPVYRALRHQFRIRSVDLVHLNNGLASDMPGILAAARSKLPVVCHVRAFSHHTYVHVRAARYVSVFLCVSAAVRDHLVDAGVDAERTVVCHDSVNQRRFRKTAVDRAGLLSQFGWCGGNRVFGIIGRLDLWKGHRYFIEAIDIARRSDADIRGLIVGDITPSARNRHYIDGLYGLVDELGLDTIVGFAGHRTDIPEILQCLDGVVCASSSPEPFGLMVVEGMAVGTPVIATNAGGPVDMITDGEDGLLVPLRDSAALADAMLRITGDGELSRRLSAAGEATVARRFTVAQHVDKVCNAYERALARG